MDTIKLIAHPEWLKHEDAAIYRDLGAALRVCVTHLQHEQPEWNIVVVHSSENTLTVSLPASQSLEFLEHMYQLAGELIHLDAMKWLRIAECSLLSVIPDLAEPAVSDEDLNERDVFVDMMQSDYLQELCRRPVMREYPMLADCLRSHSETIQMLRKMKLPDCAWDQNLLVAMDGDNDFDQFMEALYKVYRNEHMTAPTRKDYFAITCVNSWNLARSNAEKFAHQSPKERTNILLVIDLRRAGFDREDQKIIDTLRAISSLDKKFLCIFRTQVMEMDLIERMVDDINDIMPVRAVVVPPAGTDVLTECFKALLLENGCTFSEDCDDLIEQWFVKEVNSCCIGGHELIRRMARDLILCKARDNVRNGLPDNAITPADISRCMGGQAISAVSDSRTLLQSMIGLAEIKQRVLEIAAQIKVQRNLAEQGVERPAIHMMFTGNPGTGKTMVARIIASILHEEGILTKGHLHEVNARELCGQHIGHTAPIVAAKCKDAYGSVLFVDEAYTLYQDDTTRDFGAEAIATLMTEMENHRDDFCVIFAGYPEDMERLMTMNPGLRSRIPYTINFPNYSRDELSAIFFRMLEDKFTYDNSLKTAAEEFFRAIPDSVMDSSDFSNARMVRNLYERVWGKAAYRMVLNNESELILRGEDLTAAADERDFRRLIETPGKKRPIGFSY